MEGHEDDTHSSSSLTSFGNSFDGVHLSAFPVVTSLSVLTSEASHGAVHTACGLSLAGTRWWKDYLNSLHACGLHDRVAYQPCFERFRFGNGSIQVAKERVRVPVVIAGVPMLVIQRASLIRCRQRRVQRGPSF